MDVDIVSPLLFFDSRCFVDLYYSVCKCFISTFAPTNTPQVGFYPVNMKSLFNLSWDRKTADPVKKKKTTPKKKHSYFSYPTDSHEICSHANKI